MIDMPVLDDKNYRRILNEALAMIPSMTDKWTDFNPQDTGIMLLEILAGMTEMQNFYLDQVGDRFYRQILAPLLDTDAGLASEELFSSYEAEQAQLRRAVTAEDYRKILLKQHRQDFKLNDIRVQINGKVTRIAVWREDSPLSPDELDAVRLCLEKYRLLTTRIYLEQPEAWTGSENSDERKTLL